MSIINSNTDCNALLLFKQFQTEVKNLELTVHDIFHYFLLLVHITIIKCSSYNLLPYFVLEIKEKYRWTRTIINLAKYRKYKNTEQQSNRHNKSNKEQKWCLTVVRERGRERVCVCVFVCDLQMHVKGILSDVLATLDVGVGNLFPLSWSSLHGSGVLTWVSVLGL